MSLANSMSLINIAAVVPEPFTGIFTSFWVFLIIAIVISLVIFVGMILLMVFLFRKMMKGKQESDELFEQQYAEASKEIHCEFCGRKVPQGAIECPNCGAEVK